MTDVTPPPKLGSGVVGGDLPTTNLTGEGTMLEEQQGADVQQFVRH